MISVQPAGSCQTRFRSISNQHPAGWRQLAARGQANRPLARQIRIGLAMPVIRWRQEIAEQTGRNKLDYQGTGKISASARSATAPV